MFNDELIRNFELLESLLNRDKLLLTIEMEIIMLALSINLNVFGQSQGYKELQRPLLDITRQVERRVWLRGANFLSRRLRQIFVYTSNPFFHVPEIM